MGHGDLTRREWDVLRLVAEGLSNSEIASRLYRSQYTIKNHIHNAIEKLGAMDRRDAVRIGLNMKPNGDTRCDTCPLASKAAVVAADLERLAMELKG